MRQAIKLAEKGVDRPSSLPRVGVVVVAGGGVVGKAFAAIGGTIPALTSALNQAGERCRGATIYASVDPSADSTDAQQLIAGLVDCGAARMVVGILESTSEASPVLDRLNEAGIEVVTGVCEQQCRRLNEAYFKYVHTQMPFVTVKFAQSLDGRLATAAGHSQWISSPSSLRLAHKLRREHDCVMVGIGTVLADDPRLTVRLIDGRNPLRVVVDSHLRIPSTARLLREGAHQTLIATTAQADSGRIPALEGLGAEVMTAAGAADGSGVDLPELLRTLGRRGVASVLVEGGAGLITSLLAARLADRLVVVVAPKLIGRGIEAIGDLGTTNLDEAITFSSVETRKLGPDVVFDARLK
ncbi:MAG TPA: bifunctional diaminohydroxyphosphoribosylaminopyrimidine deaminase/5-amino-6-(5-phosphoribosylamino)uracil reductase RibD [Blastocatellia bacterium]|jgi:diaminohydroxyphosphoribosylaminopyrimidine deaminase/5-amino-6-(5-phosphoribosylamino)uracil reductase|nr:bifunctional diaminohydroxyphosphoribosylaminopyrimidine deaminase/5-amino-6-(5-phosphoribosylamino)uracil reductase RibD [Blastocatellia bacterium]